MFKFKWLRGRPLHLIFHKLHPGQGRNSFWTTLRDDIILSVLSHGSSMLRPLTPTGDREHCLKWQSPLTLLEVDQHWQLQQAEFCRLMSYLWHTYLCNNGIRLKRCQSNSSKWEKNDVTSVGHLRSAAFRQFQGQIEKLISRLKRNNLRMNIIVSMSDFSWNITQWKHNCHIK